MMEKKTATKASHQRPTLMTASRTSSLAMKPTVGGTPAMENMTSAIMAACQESRSFRPLRSSRRSTSNPSLLIITSRPKPPAAIRA